MALQPLAGFYTTRAYCATEQRGGCIRVWEEGQWHLAITLETDWVDQLKG